MAGIELINNKNLLNGSRSATYRNTDIKRATYIHALMGAHKLN